MFTKENFDILLEHCRWDHAIELIPGVEPKSSKIYPLSPLEQTELDTFLEENLCTRRIQPSKSPIAAPVFFIKKKDSLLQLVQDYCTLNAITIKNRYSLPLISELVSQLRGAKLSQKVTYLFCDELDIVSKSLEAELGKQQKMLLSLRSNP